MGKVELHINNNAAIKIPYHIPVLPDMLREKPQYELISTIAVHGGNMFSRRGERVYKKYLEKGYQGALNIDERTEALLDQSVFSYQYNTALAKTLVKFPARNDLNIEFLTAHKSKGLQADYVFILNNKRKGMGFPSKMQDDGVLEILLEGSDTYEYAEERRLFYVAMTRARKKVWMLVQKGNESCFVKELSYAFEREIKNEKYTCPECGGRLIKRNGKYGEFFGCSNFKNGCKYTRNIGGRTRSAI